MMKKVNQILFIFCITSILSSLPVCLFASEDGSGKLIVLKDFRLEGQGEVPSPYRFFVKDQCLFIEYHRTPESADWASVDWQLGSIDVTDAPLMQFEIKSSRTLLLAMKLFNSKRKNLWFERYIQASESWNTLTIDISSIEQDPFTLLQFYFNPAVGIEEQGQISIRNFCFGTAVTRTPELDLFQQAITDADRLFRHIKEGAAPGYYPKGTRNRLGRAIQQAKWRVTQEIKNPDTCRVYLRALYNACLDAESTVIIKDNPLSDQHPTWSAVTLYRRLKDLRGNHCLFGMQDMTSYGIEPDSSLWLTSGSGDRSDPKTVCGSHAALLGLDIFNIAENVIPAYSQLIREHHARGGLVTLCWHQNNLNGGSCRDFTPVIQNMLPGGAQNQEFLKKLQRFTDFASTLRGPDGQVIPILFRPYHEHNGDWFYWGKGRCKPNEYQALWRYTIQTLRGPFKQHQLIVVTSLDGNQYDREEDYLFNYPGDDVVDVLGLDFYFGRGDSLETEKLVERLRHAVQWANRKNKIAALTETGDRMGWDATEMLEIDNWYTRCLLQALKTDEETRQIVYAQVWRNGHIRHHFVPYPGHYAVADFLRFYYDPFIWFLKDIGL